MASSAQDSVFATVLVGPNHARFVVHEALLVHHSEFFRAALTGNFKEAEEKVVKMADTEPYIFECFVHWLYYQRFPDASKGDDEELVKIWGSADEAHTLITNLVKMYVMGDQNIMPRLQRDALDSVFHHISYTQCTLPDDDHVKCAFDYLDPEDPLCRYLVDANFYGDNCLDDDFNPYDISENLLWHVGPQISSVKSVGVTKTLVILSPSSAITMTTRRSRRGRPAKTSRSTRLKSKKRRSCAPDIYSSLTPKFFAAQLSRAQYVDTATMEWMDEGNSILRIDDLLYFCA
jgi:hypothetical protein